jgi:hypothetical protein
MTLLSWAHFVVLGALAAAAGVVVWAVARDRE